MKNYPVVAGWNQCGTKLTMDAVFDGLYNRGKLLILLLVELTRIELVTS
jgi:hypothetical protein